MIMFGDIHKSCWSQWAVPWGWQHSRRSSTVWAGPVPSKKNGCSRGNQHVGSKSVPFKWTNMLSTVQARLFAAVNQSPTNHHVDLPANVLILDQLTMINIDNILNSIINQSWPTSMASTLRALTRTWLGKHLRRRRPSGGGSMRFLGSWRWRAPYGYPIRWS